MANKRAPTRARKASRAATLLSLAPPGHSRRGSVPGHSRKTRSVPAGVHRPLPGPAKTLSPLGLVSPALPPALLGQPTRPVAKHDAPGAWTKRHAKLAARWASRAVWLLPHRRRCRPANARSPKRAGLRHSVLLRTSTSSKLHFPNSLTSAAKVAMFAGLALRPGRAAGGDGGSARAAGRRASKRHTHQV